MGHRKKNSKKRKSKQAESQKPDKAVLISEESSEEERIEEDETVAFEESGNGLEEPEVQPTYEELFSEEIADETSSAEEISALRERLQRSILSAGRRELAGKRRIHIPISNILSRLLWTGIVFALVGVIVWQSAEVVAAKVEYARSNDFYVDLANKHSLSVSDNGLTSVLYGEKEINGTPDYKAMQNGAQIIDKQTLTSAQKKELAIISAKMAALKKQNPDTMGWIYIPGTNIDYPIVMPPVDDPEYYMDHSFSGANYSTGAIFVETRCRPGILLNQNTIIVGHNIRLQGMMFNQLVKFGEEDFFKDHTEVYIYTEEGKFVFNLFSFYRVNQNYNFRRVNFKTDGEFLQYLEAMRQNSWYYRQGIEFSPDDRIITMYTCTNDNIKTNRYVAVAVLQECLLIE